MKKIILSLSAIMALSGSCFAQTASGITYGKTSIDDKPAHFNNVLNINSVDNNTVYCFIGEKQLPCIKVDNNLVQETGPKKVLSYDYDINDPDNSFIPATGQCVIHPDNELQCFAKTDKNKFSVEFKLN